MSFFKRLDCVVFHGISEDDDYLESNKMHGINGFLYANLPGLELCLGDRVSWHLIGLGNEVDMHTAYFYGNTFTYNGNVKDTVSLLPGNIENTERFLRPAGCFEIYFIVKYLTMSKTMCFVRVRG